MILHSANTVARLGARLGEGPMWMGGSLWQVDILGKAVFRIDNTDTEKDVFVGRFDLEDMPGCIVPCSEGSWLVACRNRLLQMSPGGGETRTLHVFEDIPEDIRFNDGKADPAGRLIVGTMALNARPGAGKLYSFDGTVRCLLEDITISNGLAWTADGRTLYYIDTPTKQVRAFDYGEDGSLSRARVVVEVAESDGKPDGMTIDREGNLWIALWGGWGVGCWDPHTGRQIAKVEVPVKNVTCCTFGGPAYDHLYITTAGGEGTPGGDPAGDLFLARLGVSGYPPSCFHG